MSKDDDSAQPIEDALEHVSDLLKSAEEKGEQLSHEGRKLTQLGQQIADVARDARPVVRYFPPNIVEPLISDLEIFNNQADQALAHIKTITSGSVNSTAGTVEVNLTRIFNPGKFLTLVPSSERPMVEIAVSKLQSALDRAADEQEVISLMEGLGLRHAARGFKSPVSLFITAHQAFKAPLTSDNPIITSLIPIREAIEHSIERLLKKRMYQEEAKSWASKILSIGKQLRYDSVPLETVESWVQQWTEMLDKQLSPAKDQDISRDEWRFRLQSATLFLKAVLSGIDPKKAKREKVSSQQPRKRRKAA